MEGSGRELRVSAAKMVTESFPSVVASGFRPAFSRSITGEVFAIEPEWR
jgi:hypothetical protein